MQFLFKRSKKRPEPNGVKIGNVLKAYFEKAYVYAKSKWAQWMTKQTAKLSFKNHLVVFWVFIACSSGYSIYLIGMNCLDTNTNSIMITPMVKPIKTFETDVERINRNNKFSKSELEKIIRFRGYLDSLALSPTGKKVLDSIRYNRPGLLDSLASIENYYQSNFKNCYYGK